MLRNYTSSFDATVCRLLEAAGGMIVGKTSMDEFGMGSHSQNISSDFVTGPVKSHLHLLESKRKQSSIEGDDTSLSPGGSSGGSAVAVATGQCDFALGTDTGGSVRLPASWTGIVGFKPTCGRISRYGVVDYATSLDTVGIFARNVCGVERVWKVLDQPETSSTRDGTCLTASERNTIAQTIESARKDVTNGSRRVRIGVPVDWNVEGLQDEVKQSWIRTLTDLQDEGYEIIPVRLPSTKLALGTYYIVATAEASSNLAKYDGIRYGHRADGPDSINKPSSSSNTSDIDQHILYSQTRSQGFGAEVQRRILLGTYTLSSTAMDNYFLQAQRVKRMISQEFDRCFIIPNASLASCEEEVQSETVQLGAKVDVLLAPTAPTLPPRLSDIDLKDDDGKGEKRKLGVEGYVADIFTVMANLAGLPALNVPVPLNANEKVISEGQTKNLDGEAVTGNDIDDVIVKQSVDTVGMQIIGQYGDDEFVLEMGKVIENMYNGKTPSNV